ncbi:interleukin-17 receptor E isoform X3 [Dromaius novaehollandiae]|uniref:interleukin-17 receptor E isoform X3 n=1 Tax=Dromaius novaehollandiae TaxID=8790 RepID=UPI00311F76B9
MGRPVPRALLLAAAAALLAAAGAVTRLRVSANFECRASADSTLSRPHCRRAARAGPPLEPPALVLSTALLCRRPQPCQPCLRVRLALPAAGLGGVRGLQLDFLELDSNRAGWLQSGRRVLVSLRTIPDRGLALSRSHLVATEPPGPVFTHAWVPEARAIEVSVPRGPALMVRLCHQLALECEELPRPFHQQVLVPGGRCVLLPYEFLVPCLCIEASYPHRDSLRSKRCPFQEQPAAYGPELWSSVRFHDYSASSKDQMAMGLSGRCPLRPHAALCWREAAAGAAPCHDIPNSTASEEEQAYVLDKVDVHPQLCFRFSYGNSSHVECPHRPETAWEVSLSAQGLRLRLRLASSVPAAFSAALCQPHGGQCQPQGPVYTVTRAEGSTAGELALLLPPAPVLGGCVLVWRSDVRFARKRLLCPDVSRRRFGLPALALALVLAVAVLLRSRCSAGRPAAGEGRGARGGRGGRPPGRPSAAPPSPAGAGGRRPVLLVYSPDSEAHAGLARALAELLRAALGCDVRLDLWESGGVGRLGGLPWLYAQRARVGRERGTVLLLWSRGSARLWRGAGAPGAAHDVFGAAMACLRGELGAAGGAGRPGGWVLAYFSRLCGPRDVPRPLRPLPTYRLPRELPRLLGALRGPRRAPRCLRARGLLRRLLEAGGGKGAGEEPPPGRPGFGPAAGT